MTRFPTVLAKEDLPSRLIGSHNVRTMTATRAMSLTPVQYGDPFCSSGDDDVITNWLKLAQQLHDDIITQASSAKTQDDQVKLRGGVRENDCVLCETPEDGMSAVTGALSSMAARLVLLTFACCTYVT